MAGVQNEINNLQRELSLSADSVDFIEATQRLLMNQVNVHAANSKTLKPNGFKKFICLDDQSPSILISKITSHGKSVAPFIELGGHPVLASARTPKIRIFKVYRDANNKAVDEVEIPLFLYGTQTVLNPQDRSQEAFFKDLSFSLKDQTSFGATRSVEASMTLGFNSFNAISKVYRSKTKNGEATEFSYIDLIRRTAGRAKAAASAIRPTAYASYSLRLEIGWNYVAPGVLRDSPELAAAAAAGADFNDVVLVLELEDYELDIQQNGMLSLTLNYHSFIDREMAKRIQFDVLTPDTRQNIYDSEKKAQREQAQKEFKAKERLESFAKQITAAKSRVNEITTRLNNLTEDEKEWKFTANFKSQEDMWRAELEVITSNIESGLYEETLLETDRYGKPVLYHLNMDASKSRRADSTQGISDTKKQMEDILNSMSRINKIARYASFMNNIMKNGRVYSFDVPKNQLLLFSPQFSEAAYEKIETDGVKEGLAKKKNDVASKLMKENAKVVSGIGNFGASLNKAINEQIIEQANKSVGKDADKYKSSIGIGDDAVNINIAVALGLNKALGKAHATSEAFEINTKRVNFIYLGDLLEQAIKDDVFTIMQKRKLGVILGSFVYENKINTVDNQQQQSSGGDVKQIKQSINFADVPISIEMFSKFFSETIIDKNVRSLSLMDFIQGMVNQLVVPAINQELGGSPVFSPVKARTTFIRATNPITIAGADGSTSGAGRFPIDNPEQLKKLRKLTSPEYLKIAKASQIWNYLTIYGVESKEIVGLSNQYDTDMERGIYNFVFGDSSSSSTGGRTDLIKDIKFVKVKKPGQREMMVERQLSGGNPDSLIELWNIFDIEMTMIGNNLFAPGKYIRITPQISGFGRGAGERSIVNELGLGGYYMVTNVSNDIGSDGQWTTNIAASWQSNGTNHTSAVSGRKLTPEEAAKLANDNDMTSDNIESQYTANPNQSPVVE
jgi:hypothetical protein